MTIMDVLDRLLIARESGIAPVSSVEYMLEAVDVVCNDEGEAGSTNVGPSLKGAKGGRHIAMDDRARVSSLADSHRNERGSSSKTVFDTIVPGLVMVGKDPAGREARKRNDKN